MGDLFTKQSNEFKPVEQSYIKVGGEWKQATPWKKIDGFWREFGSSIHPFFVTNGREVEKYNSFEEIKWFYGAGQTISHLHLDDEGMLYMPHWRGEIHKVDEEGNQVLITGAGNTRMYGAAVNKHGWILVGRYDGRYYLFDKNGDQLTTQTLPSSGSMESAEGVCFSNEQFINSDGYEEASFYVAMSWDRDLYKINFIYRPDSANTRGTVWTASLNGSVVSFLQTDSNGDVYALGRASLEKFDKDTGDRIFDISLDWHISNKGLEIDDQDRIFVSSGSYIKRVDQSGDLVWETEIADSANEIYVGSIFSEADDFVYTLLNGEQKAFKLDKNSGDVIEEFNTVHNPSYRDAVMKPDPNVFPDAW